MARSSLALAVILRDHYLSSFLLARIPEMALCQ